MGRKDKEATGERGTGNRGRGTGNGPDMGAGRAELDTFTLVRARAVASAGPLPVRLFPSWPCSPFPVPCSPSLLRLCSHVLLLAVLQAPEQAQAQAPSPIAKVEVSPATAEVEVGQTLAVQRPARWTPRASRSPVRGFTGSTAVARATSIPPAWSRPAIGAPSWSPRSLRCRAQRPVFGQRRGDGSCRNRPAGWSSRRCRGTVLVGTRLTLRCRLQHPERPARRRGPVHFQQPPGGQVTPDGRLRALAPGRATITGQAGKAKSALLRPGHAELRSAGSSSSRRAPTVRTGDVVRFKAVGSRADRQERSRGSRCAGRWRAATAWPRSMMTARSWRRRRAATP